MPWARHTTSWDSPETPCRTGPGSPRFPLAPAGHHFRALHWPAPGIRPSRWGMGR